VGSPGNLLKERQQSGINIGDITRSIDSEKTTEMKKYPRTLAIWILVLTFTSFLLPAAYSSAVNSLPSCQLPITERNCDAIDSDESQSAGAKATIHAYDESKRSALKIESPTEPLSKKLQGASVGTGWPIGAGYVVTSNHVVTGCNKVVVISRLGEEFPARIVLRDHPNDVAILEVSDIGKLPPALPLATTRARLGATVFTIGYPRVHFMGKSPKLFTGIISSVNGLHDDPTSYHTTVPIQPGNSGGPLLNMSGEVVGLVTSMLGVKDTDDGTIDMLHNASCVLKIASVKKLLPLLPKQDPAIDVLPRGFDSLESLAERIEGSILIVVAK